MGYKLFMKLVEFEGKTFLTSPVAYGEASVTFVSGDWSSGPRFLEQRGYGITYFDSIDDARNYAELVIPKNSANDFEIWKVEYQEPIEELPKPLSLIEASIGNICESGSRWFSGTKMSVKVKPVERVRLYSGKPLLGV